MDALKQLNDYQITELRINLGQVCEVIKCASENDLQKIEQLQEIAAIEGGKRLASHYHKKLFFMICILEWLIKRNFLFNSV